MASSWTGSRIEDLDTPALLIDLDRLAANIERMQAYAAARGLAYRPHTKTHKIPEIAQMQLRAGAVGVTVAKLGEAEVMAAGGLKDLLIANQVVGAHKLRRLVALAREVRVAVGVDHPEHARMLGAAFQSEPRPVDVLIEVDTGNRRAGTSPDRALELAEIVNQTRGVRLRGIFTHEGRDYSAATPAAAAEVGRAARRQMVEVAQAIEAHLKLDAPLVVSVGSTPAVLADMVHGFDLTVAGVNELRCGTSVFFDAMQTKMIGHSDWCAASVLAAVTSTPDINRAVADAGAKSLSIDRVTAGYLETPGHGLIPGFEDLRVTRLNDEHAVIEGPEAGERLRIGERIRIIPNHICPCVNLHDEAYGVRNGRVEVVWPVAARGKVR